jgi:hypothetical protein
MITGTILALIASFGTYVGILEFLGNDKTKKQRPFADVPHGSGFVFYKNGIGLACIKLSPENNSLHFEGDKNAVIIDEPWRGTLICVPPTTLVGMDT